MLCLMAASAIPGVSIAQTAVSRSHFDPGTCAVAVAADETIDCGVLIVPENRAVADSRMIRLPVMIFRSRAAQPLADPVMFLTAAPETAP